MAEKTHEKAQGRDGLFEGFAGFGRNLINLDGAKKFAAWYIDTSEKYANEMLDMQATATEWAKETPIAPIFEAQQDLTRKFVKRSADVARTLWQLNN